MLEITGGSFPAGFWAVTVAWNTDVAVPNPSLTVTVTCAVPVCPAAGVITSVRFVPVPLTTSPEVGSSALDDEATLTLKLLAALSASLTLNPIGTLDAPW